MGKGGGRAHTPREAKDNLKSTQMMSVIDAIGEGPIEGPVKGLQSILVNKTPLTDTDGNPVIHGVTAVWRAGEQEQTPPEGFESSGSETVLGVEVTRAKPVTRAITSANIDRLRVTGSDDARHSNTSLAWGAGVQFNPAESVAVDVAYEGCGSGDWRTDGFIVGVGYKF